jgi:hypothetical protein
LGDAQPSELITVWELLFELQSRGYGSWRAARLIAELEGKGSLKRVPFGDFTFESAAQAFPEIFTIPKREAAPVANIATDSEVFKSEVETFLRTLGPLSEEEAYEALRQKFGKPITYPFIRTLDRPKRRRGAPNGRRKKKNQPS